MTDRDEQRARCAKIIAIAFIGEGPWGAATEDEKGAYICDGLDAFDALNGIVRVCQIDATEDSDKFDIDLMERTVCLTVVAAKIDKDVQGLRVSAEHYLWLAARAMSAIGDLTNPPEKP